MLQGGRYIVKRSVTATMAPILNSLVVENFKTYSGSNVIGPLQPFTAIVGPNGGGKSNMMDAVAFVLGERVTALRVKNGTDLIHQAGVHDGDSSIADAPDSASVTANFLLTDGSEMEFKRVVSSGGSEFFVEGKRVSFISYLEKLKGLGVNVRCSNFMVFQGSVESIAMYGSHRKTELFEELSGSGALSSEYNHLKEEMARAEEQALKVFEQRVMVADRLKELKEDSKKEKEYEWLEMECEKKKIKLQLFRLYHMTQDLTNLQEDLIVKKNKLKQLEENQNKVTQLVENILKDQSAAIQDATTLEQNVDEMETQLRKKRSELVTAKECVSETKKKEETCLKLVSKAKEAQEDHQRKVEELQEMVKKVETLAAQYEEELSVEAVRMGTSMELKGEQLQQYHQLKQQAGQRCASLQQKLDTCSRQLKAQLDQMANENRQMEEGREALRRKGEEVDETKRRLERLTESLKGITQSMVANKLVLKELEKGVKSKRNKEKQVKAQLETLTEQLNDATWDVSQTRRRHEQQERVEELRELYPGVLNRLRNLCQPIHPRYQLAITRVLLKHMDSIVVDSVTTARSCIQYLKSKRITRETFLPLNYLQPRPLTESLRAIQEPVHVRLAFDLIKFEPQSVKVAVLFVTKDTLVCETPEDAMKVAYELENRHNAVALDGTFYSKSGLVSGGKLELEHKAKAWGEKAVAKMRSNKDNLMMELKEVQKVAREESEMKVMETQVRGQEAQIKYSSLEADKFRKQIKEMEEQQKRMEDEVQAHANRCKEMKVAASKWEAEIREIQVEMETVENEVFRDFCREIAVPNIHQYEEQGLQALIKQEDKRCSFTKQMYRIKSLIEYEHSKAMEGEVKKREAALRTQTKTVQEAMEMEKKKINEMEEVIRRVAELRSNLVEKKRVVREVEERMDAAQEKAKVARREKEKLWSRVFNMRQKIANLKLERSNILKECHIKGLEIPIVSGSLNHALRTKMDSSLSSSTVDTSSEGQSEADIEVDFSSLPNLYKQRDTEEHRKLVEANIITSINDLEKTLASTRAPGKNIGEHLQQMKEQVTAMGVTLKEKQGQAKQAKEAFQIVQKQRHHRFMNCFKTVSKSIDILYKGLCRSTSAQAVLETNNPEEPYLGSIIYHCIPSGKRCKNMWSLSGGERAMASLAFLFSLHSYQPAPFFILDEVDAALDKSNISKVSSYLRDHKEEVQILIISHKEEMYYKADSLCGITRKTVNDYGSSRVFSLDLTQHRRNRHHRPQQRPPTSPTKKRKLKEQHDVTRDEVERHEAGDDLEQIEEEDVSEISEEAM